MSYLIAHFGKSLLWHGSLWLFAFFLTETCGVPPRTMGLVICGSLCANALADLVTVRWLRQRGVSWPIVSRLQRRGAMLAGLFFILFSATPFLPVTVRTPFALMALLGFRITFAMLDMPQNAMVALLASAAETRAKALAARNITAGLANLLVGGVAAPLLLSRVDGAWGHLVWAGGVTAIMGCSAQALSRCAGPNGGQVATSGKPLRPPYSLPPWLLPLTGMIVVASTLFRSMEPYAVAYADMGARLLWWSAVGSIVCQPVWAGMLRRLPLAIPPLLAALVGLVPIAILGNAAPHSVIGVEMIGLGFGIASGGIWLMLWSAAMGEAAADEAAARVARLTAVSKVAQGLAALCLGELLHGTPYRRALADPASSPRMMMIGALGVIVLCGIALAAAQRRVSRKAGDEGSATPHRAARPVPVQAVPPPTSCPAHERHVAPAR